MTQQTQWLMFFNNERELINAVGGIDVHRFNELCQQDVCSGYQYITRISRAIKAGDELSDAQVRAIKRLAKQVHKYYKNV